MLTIYSDMDKAVAPEYTNLEKVREELVLVLKAKGSAVKAWEFAKYLEGKLNFPRMFPAVLKALDGFKGFSLEQRGKAKFIIKIND